jgi:hypothetical protein
MQLRCLEQTKNKHSVGGLIVRVTGGLNLKKNPVSGTPEAGFFFVFIRNGKDIAV